MAPSLDTLLTQLSEWNPSDIPSQNLKATLNSNFRTSSQFSYEDCIANIQEDLTADCL